MHYFVTGITGFIGTHLAERLMARRGAVVYALVRPGSEGKLDALRKRLGVSAKRLIAITGQLEKAKLGLSKQDLQMLGDVGVNHFFHLAALYDVRRGAEDHQRANVDGTANALALARTLNVGCFHHISSIAAAGLYQGVFREDMFEEAGPMEHPYLQTKHDAEGLVRLSKKIPWRIYRPAMVVGHSVTGEIDKVDGPYYAFKFIQKMRYALPEWVPAVGIEGGTLNIVPVDFIADALDEIAHQPGLDGQCFHLTDPKPHKVGEVLNIIAKVAHAPQMSMRVDLRLLDLVPSTVRTLVGSLGPVRRVRDAVLDGFGLPADALSFVRYPTKFDRRNTDAALAGTGIEVPPLRDYAAAIWDYWERHLDAELHRKESLQELVENKVVVVTGATSGIGKATALKLAETDATIVLVARTVEKLQETKQEIAALGGRAVAYSCDVSDMEDCDRLIDLVIADHGRIDILVNNAGRSIRRSIKNSVERFHDFERTMQLNYFGALRLIMRALPHMQAQGGGQVINISSIGVLTNAPRFSAYVASKAALDAFSRCAATEYSDRNVRFTTINMPLVKTPMISPTKIYDHFPTLLPEEAADLVMEAIVDQPKRIATRLGVAVQIMHFVTPKLTEVIMNVGFNMFGDSAAAKKSDAEKTAETMSTEQMAFSYLMRGIHW